MRCPRHQPGLDIGIRRTQRSSSQEIHIRWRSVSMMFVIVGPLNQQDWVRGDTGNDIYRARMVVVDSVEYLGSDDSSWREHRRQMTSRRDISLEPGKDIGKGAVGDDGLDGWFIGSCQNECSSPQRLAPSCNSMWPTEFWIGIGPVCKKSTAPRTSRCSY